MIRVVDPHLTRDSDASGDRERRVVCSKPLGARHGDLLLREAPFAALLAPSLWTTHCHKCFRSAEQVSTALSRCGRCRLAHYCSRSCQQKDWKPDHQVECARLAQLTALRLRESQVSDVLLLSRVVRRVVATAGRSSDDLYSSPLELAWNQADSSQETELLVVLTHKLGLIQGESTATSIDHLQRMLSRFQNNNFGICDARLLPVAAGCFPLAAMVNHSCEPNAVITYEASTHSIEFRAIRAIALDEEVTHAYVDMALPRAERQDQLLARYHFKCTCSRCLSPMDDGSSRDQYLDAGIDGVTEGRWVQAHRRQVDERMANLQQAESAAIGDRVHLLEKTLEAQSSILHPLNIRRLSILSQLLNLQIQDPQSLGRALKTGEEMLRVYERVYSENHPMLGLHLFTLGDLCAAQDKHQQATDYLSRAEQILSLTHGEKHEFVQSLRHRLAQI